MQQPNIFGYVIVGAIALFLYFLPTFRAKTEGANEKACRVVFWINLLTGWTLIGWFIALVIAVSARREILVNIRSK